MAFSRGSQSRVRDPTRFALLDAFLDADSYVVLAGLLKSVVPFRLDDLEPEKFKREIAANPEHTLEAYVELADRVGGLSNTFSRA